MTWVPASSHGPYGPDIDGTNGAIAYDDDGPLLDLLAKAGFTFDLKVRDADDASSYVLIRSPNLLRMQDDNANLTARTTNGVTNLFRFSPAVGLCTSAHSPPSDGTLQTGELSMTFDQTAGAPVVTFKGKDSAGTVAAGNLPMARAIQSVAPVSGTAFSLDLRRDVFLSVPVTYNPTGLLTATCQVAVSPDGVSFTVLSTKTVPAIAALAGLVDTVDLALPAGWSGKLTVVNATLGTGIFY